MPGSIWRAIKNLFIPWNLIRSSAADEREGTRSIDYGQLLIDGATGDIADITRMVGRAQPPPHADDRAETRRRI